MWFAQGHKQFAFQGLPIFPFYRIVSYRYLAGHPEVLFLVAEVLVVGASSCCKYKLKYGISIYITW